MSDKNLSAVKKSRRGGSRVIAVVILVVCVLVLAAGVAAGIYVTAKSDRYSGYVTDGSGAPMAGVSVTNGKDVVKTDENGYYVMDGWLKDRFVTVTIPSGYWTEDYYIEVGDAKEGYDFTLGDKLFIMVADYNIGTSTINFGISHLGG